MKQTICKRCKNEGFVLIPKYLVKKKIYCSKTQTETIKITELGGVDICPQCQELSEIQYKTQYFIQEK
jgi:hypothetical protein|tara:strand:+ start:28163 stop:28366 length:204 start_codon:yes stop_codon:yes gene_type:complete